MTDDERVPPLVVSVDIGVVRIHDLKCRCGRAFVAGDLAIDDNDTVTMTCGQCHDRPIEVELLVREGLL